MARERCVVVVHAAVARVVTMQRGSYKAVPRCHADDYAALNRESVSLYGGYYIIPCCLRFPYLTSFVTSRYYVRSQCLRGANRARSEEQGG